VACLVETMLTSKFKTGQIVFLGGSFDQRARDGAYIITKTMPERDGEPEYRVKSVSESHEHVVLESQVRFAGD